MTALKTKATGPPSSPDDEVCHYIACIDLRGRSCLVVGGGYIAHEKAQGLLDCGARVTVVAPDVKPEVEALGVEVVARSYERGDIEGRFLVVAATSNTAVNRAVFADAERAHILCNVADVPELCSFILPAIHRESPIAIAVSTGGASPALAQQIRADIAQRIGPEYAILAKRLRALRPWAKKRYPTYERRRDFFQRLVERSLP